MPPRPLPLLRAALFATLVSGSLAGSAAAVEPASGVVFSAGIGGGTELGMGSEKAGLAESELSLGWEHAETGIRPEVALGIGIAPDTHFALRPGLRWVAPELPIHFRVAADWSSARTSKRWRWLLVGGAFESRWTSAFSLFVGLDVGFPIGDDAGLPLIVRGGAAFRF